MSSWIENDLRVVELDYKIKYWTNQFNEKYGEDIEYYIGKRERFLKNRLSIETAIILKEHILLTSSGIIQNQKV